MRCNHLSMVVVCLCAISATHVAAQQAQNNSSLIVRAYNVSDLIRQSSDYPLESRIALSGVNLFNPNSGRGSGSGGGNPFGQQSLPVPGSNVGPLIELITRTIEPDSWTETGRISSLGTTLVVRQTGEIQNRIQQLLDEVRKANGPAQVMTVRMTWVLCAARELPDPKTEVTTDWINKQKAYCESQITCFSGQTVHLSTGQSRNVISDVTPVIATGSVAFDPTMSNVLSGTMLQITPQIVPGSDTAILDVQTIINQASGPDEAKPLSIAARAESSNITTQNVANIDRMTTVSQEFKTTARLSMKKKVIVGGMTLDPSATDHAGQQLYLVAEIDAGK